MLCFFGQAISCPNRRRLKGVKIKICITCSMECTSVIRVFKIVVTVFLNQWMDKICKFIRIHHECEGEIEKIRSGYFRLASQVLPSDDKR